jgi:hypothetical protein
VELHFKKWLNGSALITNIEATNVLKSDTQKRVDVFEVAVKV